MTTLEPQSPPRLASWLLERILSGESTRFGLIGDLYEDYWERYQSFPVRSRLWYWIQTLRILFRFAFSAFAGPLRDLFAKGDAVPTRKRRITLQELAQDLRYAIRTFTRNRTFALIAVSLPALAIAANSAVFSVLDATLLTPLPYPQPDRLVLLSNLNGDGEKDSVSPADYLDWKRLNDVCAGLAAYQTDTFNLTGGEEPLRLVGLRAAADLFPVLGLAPALGRPFHEEEDVSGAAGVVLLSSSAWQSLFQGRSDILGQILQLNGIPHEVIGVLPPEWRFPSAEVQLVVPLALTREQQSQRRSFFLSVVARLLPGRNLAQANQSLQALVESIRAEQANTHNLGAIAEPLQRSLAGNFRSMMALLQGAVVLLLLAACGNQGNLLMARGSSRSRELATRVALGAGQARISRQILTESLLLALAAGLAGLGLAHLLLRFLIIRIPQDLSWANEISLNSRVVLFSILLSLTGGILFGLAPVFQARRIDLSRAMNLGSRGSSTAGQLRSFFVVAQVMLAVVLLTVGVLFVRSFSYLNRLETGFEPSGLLTMRVDLPDTQYPLGPERVQFYNRVLEGVRSLPGVEKAGFTAGLPFSLEGGALGFTLEDREVMEGLPTWAVCRGVSDGYFETLRISLLSGRLFRKGDMGSKAAPTVIVNSSLARRYFGNEDPVGERFKLFGRSSSTPWAEIVGVVQDVRRFSLQIDLPPAFYLPYGQLPIVHFEPRDLVIRSRSSISSLPQLVREEIRRVDPNLPVYGIRSMNRILEESVALPRFNMFLFGLLGLVTALLAATGIYGVVSYDTGQRIPEIGIRMALGAGRSRVLSMVLGSGARLGLASALLGLLLAYPASRLLAGWTYGIQVSDPLSFLLVGGGSLVLVGGFLFGAGNSRDTIDPHLALRQD